MDKTFLSPLLFLLLFLSIGCGQSGNVVKNDVVTIGSILPLTGDAAQYGIEFQHSAQIAMEEINTNGGIHGKKLEINFQDARCSPKDATTIMTQFADINHYTIVLGGGCSGETLGAAPIAEKNKILILSPSSSSPDITQAGDFIFRTNPSDAYAGKVGAETALSLGYKKAATLSEMSDYAQALKKVFETNFKEKGGEAVASENFASEDTDFRSQITKIKGNNPDVIYLAVQSPAKGELVLKQFKELNIHSQIIMDAVMIRGIIKEMGKELDGMIGIEADFNDQAPKAKNILDRYKAKYGEPQFPFYDAATYDAVYLIAESIQKYDANTEAIRDYWYSLKNWPGAIGGITFDKNGDLTMKFRAMQVKNGKFEKISL